MKPLKGRGKGGGKRLRWPAHRPLRRNSKTFWKGSRTSSGPISKSSRFRGIGIDPEDITQEVRIKIWKLVDKEKIIVNYASYIKKIVDTVVIDQLRLLKKDEQLYKMEKQKQIAEQMNACRPEVLKNDLLKEAVGKAVESLIESRRSVVKLYLFDLSIEEISRFYGWSLHKTRNLLYRGLADLKTSLIKADIEYGNER